MKTEEAEKILKFIADSLVDTKEFALSQAPDLVQQLILWKRTESVMIISLFFILATLSLIVSRSVWKQSKVIEDEEEKDNMEIVSTVIGFVCFTCFCIATANVFAYLSVWIAPKIYVLDYCADMLK